MNKTVTAQRSHPHTKRIYYLQLKRNYPFHCEAHNYNNTRKGFKFSWDWNVSVHSMLISCIGRKAEGWGRNQPRKLPKEGEIHNNNSVMYNKIQIWRHKIPLSTCLVESVFSVQLSASELVRSTILSTKILTPPLPKSGKTEAQIFLYEYFNNLRKASWKFFLYNFNIFSYVMKLCRRTWFSSMVLFHGKSWR